MSIKGFKSQQALKSKLKGYTEDQSVDQQRYVTVQEMNGRRHALDVLIHGCYQVTTLPLTVEAGSNIRVLKITGHGANPNDIIRLSDGTEFAALSVPDADTIITTVELDTDPTGDTVTIWRHITPSYNNDGSLNVVASLGPTQFKKDGTNIIVNEDTAVAANTDAFPSKMFIEVDGIQYPVRKDTSTPSNTVSVPVEVSGVSGPINITAGDLNVQLSDQGPNADVTRIGNGTNQWGINSSNEGKVHDADVLAELQTIDGHIDGVETLLGDILTDTSKIASAVAPDGGAQPSDGVVMSGHTGTGIVKHILVDTNGIQSVNVNSSSLPAGAATAANQSTLNTRVGDLTETAPLSDTASSGLNGRLQRIAQRLSSLIALLPSSIGQKASTDSLSIVVANDQVVKNQEISSNGTDPFSTKLITYNAQSVSGLSNYFSKVVTSIMHGWDATNSIHKEILIDSTGNVQTKVMNTVIVASDNTTVFKTREELNTSGSINKGTLSAASTTVNAPANAVGFVVKNHSNSNDNLYWAIGATADADSNDLLPGQGSAFIPCSANISLYAVDAKYIVQWVVK